MREADKEPFACCGFCVPAGVCAARVRQWWLLMTQTFTHFLFWHILWIFLSGKKNFFLFVFFYTKLTIEAQRCLSRGPSISTAAQKLAMKLLRGENLIGCLQAAVVPHGIVKVLWKLKSSRSLFDADVRRLRASETRSPLNESCHPEGRRKWSADLRVWEVVRFSH